ncbi:MAG TPA: c-type cytochrome [Gemmataceae bacterium]|nr:c-type cytochrome [Gemmataceae bacterium]
MISTRKIACPFCDVKLRVADTLPAGKVIKCPKCGEGFPIPDSSGDTPVAESAAASSAYAFTQQETKEKVKRVRKPAPAQRAEEEPDDEEEAQPKRRKRHKKEKEPASNAPLIWGLVIGGAVPLLIAVVLAVVFRPWEKKTETVAARPPSQPAATEPGSPDAPPAPRPGRGRRGFGGEPGPVAQRPVAEPIPSGPASTGTGSDDLIAHGQQVFQANNCGRCHAMGGGGRRGRGPDLSHVGANRSADWLSEHIRDPHSHNPDSRMPSFGGRIRDDDLRALGSYLASLK